MLTTQIFASFIAHAGTALVWVFTFGAGTSHTRTETIMPRPTVTGLSPTRKKAGSGDVHAHWHELPPRLVLCPNGGELERHRTRHDVRIDHTTDGAGSSIASRSRRNSKGDCYHDRSRDVFCTDLCHYAVRDV